MKTVDEILSQHRVEVTREGPEISADIERYPRAPHAATVRELSRVSSLRGALAISFQWALIIASLAAAARWPYWYVYLAGILVIATRMQALGVLLHDGVHYMLFRNRAVNDLVCDLTVAFPLGMSTTLYRKTHFRHHRFTNTELDQDLAAQREEGEWYEWPKSRGGLAWTLIRAALGVNVHHAWVLYKHWAPWHNFSRPVDDDFPMRSRVLYVASAIAVYSLIIWGFRTDWRTTLALVLMYSIPGMTLLNLINRVRATAEHIGTEGTHELNSTRTVLPTWLERLTIAPFNVSYHLEHHLFPSVPRYNLARLHRHLLEDELFRSRAHLTRSYVGLLRELMTLPADNRTGDNRTGETGTGDSGAGEHRSAENSTGGGMNDPLPPSRDNDPN